jgi:hypothetical protein
MTHRQRSLARPAGAAALLAALSLAGSLARAQPPSPPAAPGSGLRVAPTRLVFEGRKRTGELVLINRSDDAATYRISFKQMEMDELGDMREADGPTTHGADRLIRYSPRQVTLGPHESQAVRLQLRLPAELAPGEYRSHLELRYVPPPEEVPPRVAEPGGGGFEVRLIPLYGVSIPVIVRHGATRAEVQLAGVELLPGVGGEPDALRLTLARQGNRSVYGDLSVALSRPDAPEEELARLRGFAVYVPNASRQVTVPLARRLSELSGATLEVRYRDAEGSGETWAARRFRVP